MEVLERVTGVSYPRIPHSPLTTLTLPLLSRRSCLFSFFFFSYGTVRGLSDSLLFGFNSSIATNTAGFRVGNLTSASSQQKGARGKGKNRGRNGIFCSIHVFNRMFDLSLANSIEEEHSTMGITPLR